MRFTGSSEKSLLPFYNKIENTVSQTVKTPNTIAHHVTSPVCICFSYLFDGDLIICNIVTKHKQ